MKPEVLTALLALLAGCLVGLGWAIGDVNRNLKRIAKALEAQTTTREGE